MPVTAKLSRQFYEKFGDEVTNELVNWLNTADSSYRTEFRELFTAHFGTLDVRMRELDVRLTTRMDHLEQRLGDRMDGFEARVEARLAAVEAGLRGVEERMELRLNANLAAMKAELLRWMFVFWGSTILAAVLLRISG